MPFWYSFPCRILQYPEAYSKSKKYNENLNVLGFWAFECNIYCSKMVYWNRRCSSTELACKPACFLTWQAQTKLSRVEPVLGWFREKPEPYEHGLVSSPCLNKPCPTSPAKKTHKHPWASIRNKYYWAHVIQSKKVAPVMCIWQKSAPHFQAVEKLFNYQSPRKLILFTCRLNSSGCALVYFHNLRRGSTLCTS